MHHLHATFDRNEIIRIMFLALDELTDAGHITKSMRGKRVECITLTDRGKEHLRCIIFSGQDKLNKPAWPEWLQ